MVLRNTILFRAFEVWAIQRLLSSPTFHRAVRSAHKKVHELRHGKDPAETGGTKIDIPGGSQTQRFLRHYVDELKDQLRGTTKK